jgi:acyl carrier protein
VTSAREARDLSAWLVQVLQRRAPGFSGAVTDDTPLTDGGLGLDSLALMDLIAEIETTLGLRLQAADISAKNFGTPGRLRRFLAGRMETAAPSARSTG